MVPLRFTDCTAWILISALLMCLASPAVAFIPATSSISAQRTQYFECRRSTVGMANDKNNDSDNDAYNPRKKLGRELVGFQSSALKDKIEAGDTVVCKLPVPSLGIYENASYELQAIYAQSFDDETQTVVKNQLNSLDDPIPISSKLYVTLFSPTYHKNPVVVDPDEVGISSVRSELGSAAWLAVPGFFWIFVATSFYNIYHERTGGSFLDAFWGR